MNACIREHRDRGFAIGLIAGVVVGAGLAMWFAPRSRAELRAQVAVCARMEGRTPENLAPRELEKEQGSLSAPGREVEGGFRLGWVLDR